MEEDFIVLDVDLPEGLEEILGPQPIGIIVLSSPEALELAGIGGAVAAVAARALSIFQGAKGFWITTRSGARVFITEEASARSASAARVTANAGVSEGERRLVASAFNKLPEAVRKEITTIEVFNKATSAPVVGGKKINVLGQWDEANGSLHVFMSGVRKNPAALDHILAHESGHAVYDRHLQPFNEGAVGAPGGLMASHKRFTAASTKEQGITDYAQNFKNHVDVMSRNGEDVSGMRALYYNENFAEFHSLYRQAKQDATGANKLVWDLTTGTRPESTAAFLDIARQLGIA
jgi:hypothetical protein